ncbi:hypothetical protein GDO78_005086 [Eleutherodactylus coqui]|uniref:Uncharacterized protein n=1 Tax=Eleutherodactylus coqui TaxID=57060 RepID=A0A8J6FJ16_ELECQ|nr:hypothetical protein GDO78_005086 [Eleutherodactylus coqui]
MQHLETSYFVDFCSCPASVVDSIQCTYACLDSRCKIFLRLSRTCRMEYCHTSFLLLECVRVSAILVLTNICLYTINCYITVAFLAREL